MIKKIKIWYLFILLEYYYNKYNKYDLILNKKRSSKSKYIKFFIKDNDDLILNKEYLDALDKEIYNIHSKYVKSLNDINRILFKLDLVDTNYIEKFSINNYPFKKMYIIKEIYKKKNEKTTYSTKN